MASIYKRTRSYTIPSGAKITERKRKATPEEIRTDPTQTTIIERWASWTDGKGRHRRGLVDETGQRLSVEARTYTISYWIGNERVEVNSNTPDRDAAQTLANKLETEAMLRARGIIDATAERIAAEQRRPIADHLAEFKAALQAKGNTPEHCGETYAQALRVVKCCNAATVRDLTASAVQSAIKSIRDAGRSLKTCNHYLRAIKTFTRWMHRDKRLADDPLVTLEAYNAATDQRRVRREMSADELTWLVTTTQERTRPEHSMSGPDRAMAYRLALGTGFRVGELRSLVPASFDLDADPPTVTVDAGHSKRRRQDVQPIRQDLAELLRLWLADKPAGQRLFAKLPHNTARMLRADLRAARAAWIDDAGDNAKERQRRQNDPDFLQHENAAGEIFDFHATRHTYISGIVASGASVKTAQELARHSSPVLTIGRYSHTRLLDLTGALNGLPDLTPEKPTPQDLQATGTDSFLPANRQQLSGGKHLKTAKRGENAHPKNDHADRREVLGMSTLGDDRRDAANQYPLPESNRCCRTENPES